MNDNFFKKILSISLCDKSPDNLQIQLSFSANKKAQRKRQLSISDRETELDETVIMADEIDELKRKLSEKCDIIQHLDKKVCQLNSQLETNEKQNENCFVQLETHSKSITELTRKNLELVNQTDQLNEVLNDMNASVHLLQANELQLNKTIDELRKKCKLNRTKC
jgi:methyl-accepting chemotaxis protein